MALTLTMPKIGRPAVDALASHQRQEIEIRARRDAALAELEDLRGKWAEVEFSSLSAEAKTGKIDKIDVARKAARLAVASADEALETLEDRRQVAARGDAEYNLIEISEQRQQVWLKAKNLAAELPKVVAEMDRVNAGLRDLAQQDHDLRQRENSEAARGGIVGRQVAPVLSSGLGLWPLVSFASDIAATNLSIAHSAGD